MKALSSSVGSDTLIGDPSSPPCQLGCDVARLATPGTLASLIDLVDRHFASDAPDGLIEEMAFVRPDSPFRSVYAFDDSAATARARAWLASFRAGLGE